MYNIRYSIARGLIHIGLYVMPESAYKRRLIEVLWDLNEEVYKAVYGEK